MYTGVTNFSLSFAGQFSVALLAQRSHTSVRYRDPKKNGVGESSKRVPKAACFAADSDSKGMTACLLEAGSG